MVRKNFTIEFKINENDFQFHLDTPELLFHPTGQAGLHWDQADDADAKLPSYSVEVREKRRKIHKKRG